METGALQQCSSLSLSRSPLSPSLPHSLPPSPFLCRRLAAKLPFCYHNCPFFLNSSLSLCIPVRFFVSFSFSLAATSKPCTFCWVDNAHTQVDVDHPVFEDTGQKRIKNTTVHQQTNVGWVEAFCGKRVGPRLPAVSLMATHHGHTRPSETSWETLQLQHQPSSSFSRFRCRFSPTVCIRCSPRVEPMEASCDFSPTKRRRTSDLGRKAIAGPLGGRSRLGPATCVAVWAGQGPKNPRARTTALGVSAACSRESGCGAGCSCRGRKRWRAPATQCGARVSRR